MGLPNLTLQLLLFLGKLSEHLELPFLLLQQFLFQIQDLPLLVQHRLLQLVRLFAALLRLGVVLVDVFEEKPTQLRAFISKKSKKLGIAIAVDQVNELINDMLWRRS